MSDTEDVDATDRPNVEDHLEAPRPGRSAEDVLRAVLGALQRNDAPRDDAGIETAFRFLSPGYRDEVGGTLSSFREHVTDPIHGSLVDHREAKRGRLFTEGNLAREKVVVTDESGEETTYEFTLSKPQEGRGADCWLVDGIELVYVGESPDHQHMPVVEFDDTEVKCKEGDILRDVLLRASGVSPHDSTAEYANCNGKGLCGTCAVEVVDGAVTERTAQEKRRLRLPPLGAVDNPDVRLSCQCRVLDDLDVDEHEGAWGQHVEEYAAESVGENDPLPVSERKHDDWSDVEGTSEASDDKLLSDEARTLLEETDEMLDDE
jgi:ferredoxin